MNNILNGIRGFFRYSNDNQISKLGVDVTSKDGIPVRARASRLRNPSSTSAGLEFPVGSLLCFEGFSFFFSTFDPNGIF